jgi:hypothetical protein
MKCVEVTQTEEGSKWLKNHKRRNELKESKLLIKEDKETKKIDHGKSNKRRKTLMGALEHLMEKNEEWANEVLKRRVMWT